MTTNIATVILFTAGVLIYLWRNLYGYRAEVRRYREKVAADTYEDRQARSELARRGYRVSAGMLYEVIHEDVEGWWTGDQVGPANTSLEGLMLLSKRSHPSQGGR